MAVAHLFGHFGNHALHKRRHGPVGLDARHLKQEVAQHALAVHAVVHFGVELHGVDFAGLVGHGCHVEGGGFAGYGKARRGHKNLVAVAHPHAAGALNAFPQGAGRGKGKVRGAVFTRERLGKLAAQILGKQLHAVADAEHRHAKIKKTGVEHWGIGFTHAGGAARKDDGRRLHGRHLRGGGDAGMYFGVNPGFAHAARDKLGNL